MKIFFLFAGRALSGNGRKKTVCPIRCRLELAENGTKPSCSSTRTLTSPCAFKRRSTGSPHCPPEAPVATLETACFSAPPPDLSQVTSHLLFTSHILPRTFLRIFSYLLNSSFTSLSSSQCCELIFIIIKLYFSFKLGTLESNDRHVSIVLVFLALIYPSTS